MNAAPIALIAAYLLAHCIPLHAAMVPAGTHRRPQKKIKPRRRRAARKAPGGEV